MLLSQRLETARGVLPPPLQHASVLSLIQLGLAEDLSSAAELNWDDLLAGDVTGAATLLPDSVLRGRITAKAPGVVAGLPVTAAVWKFLDARIEVAPQAAEGDKVKAGQLLAEVSGAGQALLAGERTALNFLGRLSGIATLTRKYVDAVAGLGTVILDTRKTAPGSRRLDKYAVRMGGGQNHRAGLFDMALVKDNHIDGAGGIRPAAARLLRKYGAALPMEVEVKNLAELAEALTLGLTRIMLDNMDLETMRQAVRLAAGQVPLEASGNVSLENVRAIAETGVDCISVGALTHSAPALDVSLRLA